MTLRRAAERRHVSRHDQGVWHTFDGTAEADPLAAGFFALSVLNEQRLAPAASVPLPPHDGAEIVTYVREGALSRADSTGASGVIQAGEFHRMTIGRGFRHTETNASRSAWTHVFQIGLRPSQADHGPGHDQKRFCAADRRGTLCVVASSDGRMGSLRLHQDAVIFSAMLESGQHLIHELGAGRSAWVHVVRGEVTLGDVVLTAGDGAGITGDRAASLTAVGPTEILLVDLPDRRPDPCHHGG